jgi:hypothetical protein
MLPTNWPKPSGMVQRRVSDSRDVQFWDEEHLVAKELKQQFPSSQPLCCQRQGILWILRKSTRLRSSGMRLHQSSLEVLSLTWR